MRGLRIFVDGDERSYEPGEVVSIGRDVDSTILVENPNVSRHHASITHEGGVWVLRDLGSSQGTFHDGQRVESMEVRGTVHVTFGLEDRGETFVLEAPAGATSAARPGGSIAGVDLQASTEIVGNRGPSGDDPTSAHTVIESDLGGQRPGARVPEAEVLGETVITGEEIRLECAGKSYQFLPSQQIRIGRDPTCEIVVANPTVSRVHAVIYHDGKGWVLTDPGSVTGVFRNGGRITSAMVVGSSAVWLGKPKVGERLVMVTATPTGAGVAASANKATSANKKVIAAVAVTIAAMLTLLVVVAGVFLFLART